MNTYTKEFSQIINEHINTLIRECETKWDSMVGDSHSISFHQYTNDLNETQIGGYIDTEMCELAISLDNEYYDFGYEVDNEGNIWKITLEWTMKSSPNPFKGVSR
jgi:hypothetical protein